jgi:hypothetical protein
MKTSKRVEILITSPNILQPAHSLSRVFHFVPVVRNVSPFFSAPKPNE